MSHSKISLDDIIRFTARTNGRDKIYRTIQYASRFLAWFHLKNGTLPGIGQPVEVFQNIESLMSITRKGKSIFDVDRCRRAS
jgi:hypothetical protein